VLIAAGLPLYFYFRKSRSKEEHIEPKA